MSLVFSDSISCWSRTTSLTGGTTSFVSGPPVLSNHDSYLNSIYRPNMAQQWPSSYQPFAIIPSP
ncbi:hypothetical protein AMTRI_Chr12g270170 [Amborella trichopoda]